MRNGAQRLPEVVLARTDRRSQALYSVLSTHCFKVLNSERRFPERVADIQNRAVVLFLDIVALEIDSKAGAYSESKRFFQGFKSVEYVLLLASAGFYSFAANKLVRDKLKDVVTVSTFIGLLIVYGLLYRFVKPFVERLIAHRHDRRCYAVIWFLLNGFLTCSLTSGSAALSAYMCFKVTYTADRVVGVEMLLYGTLFLLTGFKLSIGFVALDIFSAWILGVLFQGKYLLLDPPAPFPSVDSRDSGYQVLKSFAGWAVDSVPLSHTFGYGIAWVCMVYFFRPLLKLFEIFVDYGHTHMSVGAFVDRFLGVRKVPEYAFRSKLNTRLAGFSGLLKDAKSAHDTAAKAMDTFPVLPWFSEVYIRNAYSEAKKMAQDAYADVISAHKTCSKAYRDCDLDHCQTASKAAVSAHFTVLSSVSIARILAGRQGNFYSCITWVSFVMSVTLQLQDLMEPVLHGGADNLTSFCTSWRGSK